MLATEKEVKAQVLPKADNAPSASVLQRMRYPWGSMRTEGSTLSELPIDSTQPVRSMLKGVVLNNSMYSHSGSPTTGAGSAMISLITTSYSAAT